LVGFASLGTTKKWPWPEDIRPHVVAHHIVACGITIEFQGKPPGPPDERYSTQILDDLIAESRKNTDSSISPVLTLFVHPENSGAIKLYERVGFQFYEHTYTDKKGVVYRGMALRL
jgi:ribosomal protein S18 acetylase RimI-like enzyme